MKRLALLVAVIALASGANLWAGEEPGKENPVKIVVTAGEGTIVLNAGEGGGQVIIINEGKAGEAAQPGQPVKVKSAADWYIESIDKIVNLTDDQKKAITDIIEARDKAMKDFQAENAEKIKAAGKAMMDAYKSKDKDVIAKAQKDYQDLYAPMHQIMKKSQAALNGILTPEQRAKLRESRVMGMVKMMTGSVKLTDEQLKQVMTASDDLIKDDGALGAWGEGDGGSYKKLNEAVQQILTPEQKTAIAKERAMSSIKMMYGSAKLTADQLQQVEAACDDLLKDQAGNTREIYKKLSEVVDKLLTDEQKEALKKGRAGGVYVLPGGAAGGGFAPGASLETREREEKK